MIPDELTLLAVAYFNKGSYAESRKIYVSSMKEYPELSKNSDFVGLDKILKQKGY